MLTISQRLTIAKKLTIEKKLTIAQRCSPSIAKKLIFKKKLTTVLQKRSSLEVISLLKLSSILATPVMFEFTFKVMVSVVEFP